ncbi:Zn finger protein [Halalkaliarchaeum sp. AArc-CO]|uniref:hypothetical protein n=1 Tax=unclassified Halalkaliarchaeum TaxID=2678344 RepID=UPI00217E66FD|nr:MULTISPECIES: hypothetical protein [unclassified Halalkaliarchaeum]MDR5673762.1 hypothetical protein [Halalkaliarchaeum sp. AArc-GB]UWG52135.1 Zn finger protein [Halalkaliarchaeum sp. AArc-CO]
MGLLDSVRNLFSEPARHRPSASESVGAYWCHDCDERIPGGDVPEDAAPECPSCGAEMSFERSPGTASCAC